MGEARRRGTLEQRKAESIQRREAEELAEQQRRRQHRVDRMAEYGITDIDPDDVEEVNNALARAARRRKAQLAKEQPRKRQSSSFGISAQTLALLTLGVPR